MADNPALRNAHRAAALAGRRAAEAAGARPTQVSVVVETYDRAVNLAGATLLSTSTLALDPRPKVASGVDALSAFAGGTAAVSSVRLASSQYVIGPITLDCGAGGYTQAQLCPPSAANTRVYYLLTGDDFAGGGERFDLVQADASRPHQVNLLVQRTAQP